MNGQRLQSAVNWLAMLPEQHRLQTPTQVMIGIDFAIANLAFPRLYDVDFGYGRPIRRRLPYDNWCGGAVVFGLPPTNADEASGVAGVEFYIGMLEKDFTKLLKDEEFCQFTKYIG
ncbi:hypothetical protein BDF22DRAFT_733790 [Syncephalis plumigaleata]|nr:hypothetical protein BDF22DRAFT_733790 [Syncephalis plumigaleata]